MHERTGSGTGHLRSGQRDLGVTHYEIHVGMPDKPGTIVELESPPSAQNGEILDLSLEDGRVLQLQVRGVSPYCRVIGERPAHERRRPPADAEPPGDPPERRRRSDVRGVAAIDHPCPHCLATDVVVTHRGLTMTTLFCTVCRHGWGESPSVVAAAVRTDRRAAPRPDSPDRRGPERIQTPKCTYCATDAYVRSARRTPAEIYFVCTGCDAMWALPR